jgi:hypothetical protein
VRRPCAAFAGPGPSESGGGPPHSKTLARPRPRQQVHGPNACAKRKEAFHEPERRFPNRRVSRIESQRSDLEIGAPIARFMVPRHPPRARRPPTDRSAAVCGVGVASRSASRALRTLRLVEDDPAALRAGVQCAKVVSADSPRALRAGRKRAAMLLGSRVQRARGGSANAFPKPDLDFTA